MKIVVVQENEHGINITKQEDTTVMIVDAIRFNRTLLKDTNFANSLLDLVVISKKLPDATRRKALSIAYQLTGYKHGNRDRVKFI